MIYLSLFTHFVKVTTYSFPFTLSSVKEFSLRDKTSAKRESKLTGKKIYDTQDIMALTVVESQSVCI